MSQSIGQKLAAARKRRDLTIEDIAHETRIHVNTLRHLEADDYSQFANFTYAKSFLSMYGRHLGLDMTDYLKEFRSADNGGTELTDTLDSYSNGAGGAGVFTPVTTLQRFSPIVAIVALFAVVCTIFGMYFLGRMHGFKQANQIASGRALGAATQAPEEAIPAPPPTSTPSAPAPTATNAKSAIPASSNPSLPTLATSRAAEPEPVGLPAPQSPPSSSPSPSPADPTVAPAVPTAPAKPVEPSGPVEVRRPAVLIEEPPAPVQEGPPAPQDN